MADNELRHHTLKGFEWKEHKYIRKENGRYIYPEDLERMRRAAANRVRSTLSSLGSSIRSKLASARVTRRGTASRIRSSVRSSVAKVSSSKRVSDLKRRGRDLLSKLFSRKTVEKAKTNAGKAFKRARKEAGSRDIKRSIEKGRNILTKMFDGLRKKTDNRKTKQVGLGQNQSRQQNQNQRSKTDTKKSTPIFSFARNEKTRPKKEAEKPAAKKPPKKVSGSSVADTPAKTGSSKSRSSGSSRSGVGSARSVEREAPEEKEVTDPEKMDPFDLFQRLADIMGDEDFDSDWFRSQGKDGDLESGMRVVFSERLGYDLSDRKIKELADYMEVEESLPSQEDAEEMSPMELFRMVKKHNHGFNMSGEKMRDMVDDEKLTSAVDLVFNEEFGYELSDKKIQELSDYIEQHDKVENTSSAALVRQLQDSGRYENLSLRALKEGASDKKLLTGIRSAYEEEFGYDLSDRKVKEIAKYLKSKAELDDDKEKGKKAVAKATKKK